MLFFKRRHKMQNSKSQNGRSMVEMLGVLAIIGVLSVGGVYGYGVAMKKHKANELLHQASMLATTISSQILTDKPLNVQDFGDSKYGTFDTPTKVNDEQFEMKITGMDEAVCTQVAKMSGGMVRQAECNGTTLTLTYNNNLSSDKVAADYNGDATGEKCEGAGYKWCSELSTPACKKDCCSGVTLNSCQESCDSSTGEITNKDDGTDCTTSDSKEGTCSDGVCEETELAYIPAYCETNESECQIIETNLGTFTVIGNGDKHLNDSFTICGSGHTVTLADIGCSVSGCQQLPSEFSNKDLWLTDTLTLEDMAIFYGYSSAEEMAQITAIPLSEYEETLSKKAWAIVFGGRDIVSLSNPRSVICK